MIMAYHRKKQNAKKNENNYEIRDSEEMREIERMRKDLGMPPFKLITRECLKCDEQFETYQHSSNFLCYRCNYNTKGDNVIF